MITTNKLTVEVEDPTTPSLPNPLLDIEFVHINKDTTVEGLEQELFLAGLAWKLK